MKCICLLLVVLLLVVSQAVSADRIGFQQRKGWQYWQEVARGESTVTSSPVFEDGIRLAAWASGDESDYRYAVASAIFRFNAPLGTRSLLVRVRYQGEDADKDGVVGRLFVRRLTRGNDFEYYYPRVVRDEKDKPLFGDTFLLEKGGVVESIFLPADEYLFDDPEDGRFIEAHIVAESSQELDVDYVDVEFFDHHLESRAVSQKVVKWRPWREHSYSYFYAGPECYRVVFDRNCSWHYCYVYPDYPRCYLEVRRNYGSYLESYYSYSSTSYGSYSYSKRVYWDGVYSRTEIREYSYNYSLPRWSSSHIEVRNEYYTYYNEPAPRRSWQRARVRERVRSVLAQRQTGREEPPARLTVVSSKNVSNELAKKRRTWQEGQEERSYSRPAERQLTETVRFKTSRTDKTSRASQTAIEQARRGNQLALQNFRSIDARPNDARPKTRIETRTATERPARSFSQERQTLSQPQVVNREKTRVSRTRETPVRTEERPAPQKDEEELRRRSAGGSSHQKQRRTR